MKWSELQERSRAAGLSNGELCRRCGLSESAMNKGLRRNSKVSAAVRKVALEVLDKAKAETVERAA